MSQVTSTSDTRVLVVDDNLLNRKLVCAILKNYDLKYDIAENGKIALDLFLTHKYNLVLMDIQMPIMNGIDCTIKLESMNVNQIYNLPPLLLPLQLLYWKTIKKTVSMLA